MAKEPSQYELKKQFGLPLDAKFLGWVIRHSRKDEFLVKYTGDDCQPLLGWGLSPESAKTFKTLRKAQRVVKQLEIENQTLVAAAFDVGKQIIVATEPSSEMEDVSPFRSVLWE